MTTYQKLKAENAKLKQDIYDLIEKPFELNTIMVRERYKMMYGTAKVVLSGSRGNCGNGILDAMSITIANPKVNHSVFLNGNP